MRQRSANLTHLLLFALLPWITVASGARAQTDGSTGPGSTGPWQIPRNVPETDEDSDDFWGSSVNKLQSIRGVIHEIEELGRIFIEDSADGLQYWIQLPNSVKIRAADRSTFGGRKKLKIEDLAAGQRILLTLRKDDGEILKLVVRQTSPEPDSEPAMPKTES